MWGRIHSNLAIDLYLPLAEFEDISSPGIERVLSCELPRPDGSCSGRKAYLQCDNSIEPEDAITLEYKKGEYFVKLARYIPDLTNETGHMGHAHGISATVYIFEQYSI